MNLKLKLKQKLRLSFKLNQKLAVRNCLQKSKHHLKTFLSAYQPSYGGGVILEHFQYLIRQVNRCPERFVRQYSSRVYQMSPQIGGGSPK